MASLKLAVAVAACVVLVTTILLNGVAGYESLSEECNDCRKKCRHDCEQPVSHEKCKPECEEDFVAESACEACKDKHLPECTDRCYGAGCVDGQEHRCPALEECDRCIQDSQEASCESTVPTAACAMYCDSGSAVFGTMSSCGEVDCTEEELRQECDDCKEEEVPKCTHLTNRAMCMGYPQMAP